jgi:fructose-1,6-bisphosphatase II
MEKPDRNLAMEIVRVTEAAALAAARWQGRGDKEGRDQAAVDAMRQVLDTVEMDGTVVIGEGEKDEAPMLYNGEAVGTGNAPPKVDIAVDPIDGTRLLAEGRPGSLAVIAAAPDGHDVRPRPVRLHGEDRRRTRGQGRRSTSTLRSATTSPPSPRPRAEVRDLTVMMLDRDRHEDAKREVREAGARLQLITDGDVAGAILAAWDDRPEVDVLFGIGGTPEGVIAACAVKALDGEHLGRLWARNDEERGRASTPATTSTRC